MARFGRWCARRSHPVEVGVQTERTTDIRRIVKILHRLFGAPQVALAILPRNKVRAHRSSFYCDGLVPMPCRSESRVLLQFGFVIISESVPLAPGTWIGPYHIQSPLGHGGMGEVYRALDTSLRRDVAIKILRPEFAHDVSRVERFQREAELLAALNHPNIATIHGLHRDDAQTALVMELIEGETLAERIARGPLSIAEAREIARQTALALEAAHSRGIIHRDLKPANIKVTAAGHVKVLDFGLAKMSETHVADEGISNLPTGAADLTQAGQILGTLSYMSPERVAGGTADRRGDIWAFGCVVFEMLAGAQAFHGTTNADIVGAVIRAEPPWSLLPSATPERLRACLRRCLHKDVHQRVSDIGEIRAQLETLALADADSAARRTRLIGTGAVIVAASIVAGSVAYILSSRQPELPPPSLSRRDLELKNEAVAAEEQAHAGLGEGPGAATLIAASRDELIAVLEERARRIRQWIDAMEEVVRSAPGARMPPFTAPVDPQLLARMKQDFDSLHTRHIDALRAGQLVLANDLATEIIYLLSIVREFRPTSVAGRSGSMFGGVGDRRRALPREMRLDEALELYPALRTAPPATQAPVDQIRRRLTLPPGRERQD